MSDIYHHVLRRTAALDEGRPVFVRLRADDEWQDAAPDRYRVVGSPISLRSHFCFIASDGARMCTMGPEHDHSTERQGSYAGWAPSEIAP